MALAYLLLGTNTGNKNANLLNVRNDILRAGIKLIKESAIYETEPWGFTSNGNFLNQVLAIDTFLKPDELLKRLLNIEKQFGRVRKKAGYESRIIDIDILLYENEIIRQEDITVPHPLMHLRRFVLAPLCEIAPSLIHPVMKKEIKVLFKDCTDKCKVWLNKRLVS
jgi:2-amino-4-hydroxy-6-hydroxymethyldihydropteridine diphosphokinase